MVCKSCKRGAHGECPTHTSGYSWCCCQHQSREDDGNG